MEIIKKNLFLLVVCVFLFGLAIYGLFEYNSSYKFMSQNYYNMLNACKEVENEEFTKEYSYCEEIVNEEPPVKLDSFNLAFYIINYTSFSYILPFIPLLIIAVGVRNIYNQIKSGMFKNIILINGYKKYLQSSFKQLLKFSCIIPIVIAFIFLISYLYSGSFDYITIQNLDKNYILVKYSDNMLLFCITYMINLFFHSLFWLCLGIICVKKSRNYIVAVISSYILYLGYSIIMEITSGLVFSNIKILNNMNIYGYVKPGNIWGYDGVKSLWIMTFYSICLVIISLMIIYTKYKKKESVIIANET